jgi:hypothetical protein
MNLLKKFKIEGEINGPSKYGKNCGMGETTRVCVSFE